MYEASFGMMIWSDLAGNYERQREQETSCPPAEGSQGVTKMDFESVWRFTYDMILGHNIWEPNYFEVHFCAVSLPKPGGIIAP